MLTGAFINRRGAGPTAVFGVGPEKVVIVMTEKATEQPDEATMKIG